MLTPCQKCLRSFLTLPSAFILSDFVDYTEFSEVSVTEKQYFLKLENLFQILHWAHADVESLSAKGHFYSTDIEQL